MINKKETTIVNGFEHVAYDQATYSEKEMLNRSKSYYDWLNERRSVREFSDKPVSKEIIENIIMSASTAPSGAH